MFDLVKRLVVLGAWCTLSWSSQAAAQVCSSANDLSFYSHGNYTVREVRINSPIDFLHAVARSLDLIKPDLPLQARGIFSVELLNAGRDLIRERLKAGDAQSDQRFRVIVVIPRVEHCDETTTHQLDVVYQVFTTNYNSYLSNSFELKRDEAERPATTAGTSEAKGFMLVKPQIGYNRTRRLFGGMQVRMQMPGGIFDTMQFAADGSSSSNFEQLELAGTREPGMMILNHLEYRLNYRHSETPAGGTKLREGKLEAQVLGVTRPLGLQKLVLRFGVSLAGGNQQTDLSNASVGEKDNLLSSGYGSLKAYLGATLQTSKYSLAGSYGLQASTEGASTTVAFVKHLADLAATARWLPAKEKAGDFHKPLDIEAHLTGGLIQALGKLPVAERFFGGNVATNFITGDSWQIRGGPFIRSIPQNRLNGAATVGPIGGRQFYSMNLTVSRPVWGHPIIPKELATDPQFDDALTNARNSTRSILKATHLAKVPAFKTLIKQLVPFKADFQRLVDLANALAQNPPTGIDDALSDVNDDLGTADEVLSKVDSTDPNDVNELPGELKDFLGPKTTRLISDAQRLSNALQLASRPAESKQVTDIKESLASQQSDLLTKLDQIDVSEAEKLADADMQLVTPVLHSFLHELNIISISPVGIFDAARIWPDKFGTRFGVGGGVRISLVNFNVTLGYAVNPHPRFQEGRGAFFFAMDVTDLFR